MTENKKKLAEQLQQVAVWRKGSQRAPHKPLLLLLSLASVQRGESRLTSYDMLHNRLEKLLIDYGPPRKSIHPNYPFWRLQNDGDFWDIPERQDAIDALAERKRKGDIPPTILRSVKANGGFSQKAYEILRSDPKMVDEIVFAILDRHFPTSLHDSILDSVGMPQEIDRELQSKRSPEFREEIIRLYEHRCAMCGFDGRLGFSNIVLEAAHIMWHACGGPDQPTNGLLLCSIHHKALDRGAIGLTDSHQIIVSQHLHGGKQVDEMIVKLGGKKLRSPLDPVASPAKKFIDWHRHEVFRNPARPTE